MSYCMGHGWLQCYSAVCMGPWARRTVMHPPPPLFPPTANGTQRAMSANRERGGALPSLTQSDAWCLRSPLMWHHCPIRKRTTQRNLHVFSIPRPQAAVCPCLAADRAGVRNLTPLRWRTCSRSSWPATRSGLAGGVPRVCARGCRQSGAHSAASLCPTFRGPCRPLSARLRMWCSRQVTAR